MSFIRLRLPQLNLTALVAAHPVHAFQCERLLDVRRHAHGLGGRRAVTVRVCIDNRDGELVQRPVKSRRLRLRHRQKRNAQDVAELARVRVLHVVQRRDNLFICDLLGHLVSRNTGGHVHASD